MSLQVLVKRAAGGGGPGLILPESITVSVTSSGIGTVADVRLVTNGLLYGPISAFPPSGLIAGGWYTEEIDNLGFDYEARFDLISGTLSSGNAGIWIPIDFELGFGRNRTTVGLSEATGTLRIREIAVPANEVSCPVSLSAERLS